MINNCEECAFLRHGYYCQLNDREVSLKVGCLYGLRITK